MPVASEPAANRVGEYVIGRRIGVGGMAVVDAAYQPRVAGGRLVALKRIAAAFATDPSARRMFLREASIVTRLEHPNVVRTYDVGEIAGEAFIAMELLEGATVSQLQRATSDRVPLAMALRVVRDALRGLHAAHELCALGGAPLGLVHQDVSPQNIHVAYEGTTRILDFGVARLASVDASRTDSIRGKPCYLAPEQLNGGSIDRRADVFAMGIVLHELLTGAYLFPRASLDAAYAAILTGAIAPPRATNPEVSEAIDAVVRKALARAPRDRFATAEEMRMALAEAQERSGVAEVDVASLGAWTRALVPPAWTRAEIELAVTGGEAEGEPTEVEGDAATLPPRASARKQGSPAAVEQTVRRAVQRASRTPRTAYAIAGAAVALGVTAVAFGPALLRVSTRAHAVPAPIATTAAPPCSARACSASHGGEAYTCRAADQTCVPIASPDCTPMYEPGDLEADDTVWFGAMFPTRGPATEANGPMNMAGTDFARQEIARETHLIEGSNAALHVRRVALVGCDDSQDAMRAAKHLVDDVGVPAILGFRSGPEVSEIAGSLLIGRQVLAVASLTSSPQITRLPQPPELPRMVWRTTYSVDRIAEVTARMLEGVLEPRRPPGATTRVTLVRPEGSVGLLSYAETFYRELRFNGRPAVDNGAAYQEITFPAGTLSKEDLASLVGRVAATHPTFVVVLGAGVGEPLAMGVEAKSKGAGTTYILPSQPLQVMKEFIGRSADRRHRVFSIQAASRSLANARFVIRYNEAHADKVTRVLNPGVSYDAFYLLAYATFALGREAVTGPSLARAFERLLPPGPPIEVGPTNVYEALGHLSTTGRIDLQGEWTALDFDPKTGEGPADFVLACAGVDESGSASGESVESGVAFGAKANVLEGSLRCP